ncbi:amino acid adenylation domain-containing protein [Winogradskyella sp.]|uniref:amino acid adenylation domain-containing protein n=1 Tax=Winogradskyella sp. TaxID=1883156 RepID=UPI003BA96DA2
MTFKTQNLPLTKSQTAIWLAEKLNQGTPLNNVPYVFNVYGHIDVKAFQLAFQQLITTTDVLRVVIEEREGIPFQIIKDTTDYTVGFEDFTDKADDHIKSYLSSRSEAVFDLSDQLFDTVLIKSGTETYKWYLNLHHLITDASSSVILFERMSKLYKDVRAKTSSEHLAGSYIDFVSYEQNVRSKNDSEVAYWQNKIEDFKELPRLYGEKATDNTITKSHRVELLLDQEELNQLRTVSKGDGAMFFNEDMALFNIFATLLFAYLFKISGQSELVIGAPIHNRLKKSFKHTAGLFIEIFPLAVVVEPTDTYRTLLGKVKAASGDYLKNGLTGSSSPKVNRSFNVVFNYINTTFPDFAGLPSEAEWLHPNHADSSHKLRFHVLDFNATGTLKLVFDFNATVMGVSRAKDATVHFKNICNTLLNNSDEHILTSPMLTSEEEHNYLKASISEKISEDVLNNFEALVEHTPHAIAVRDKHRVLTFNELNKKANQLAHYLIRSGVDEHTKVVLYNRRSMHYIIGVLAIMKTRGAFVPIASDQPNDRVAYIISDSGCKLVITDSWLEPKLSTINVPVLNLEKEDYLAKEPIHNLLLERSPKDIAYILYTSGTTGRPKGVMISHKALSNYIFWARDYYNITSDSVMPLFTSIGFDLTITSTLLPLVSGGTLMLYAENDFGPDMSLMQVMADNLVNTIKLTPSHLSFIKDRDLSSSLLKTIIVGGENFKLSLAKSIIDNFNKPVKIYNEYGPTEATVGCIVGEFLDEYTDVISVPIGLPIKNMHAYILDDHKNLVPNGVTGHLYLSGTSLAEGYLNLDALTQKKFLDNPFVEGHKMYATGDLARINRNGVYEFLGRADDQVKLRGYRIELEDIESNLSSYKDIDDCTVVLIKSDHQPENEEPVINCTDCGLPSSYPQTDFDEYGVCNLCNAFKGYKHKVDRYFKTEEDLKKILLPAIGQNPKYDCLSLLSGGKDSTYILARLVSLGLKVLAFTLDNGYISDQAKANIDRIVEKLGVDHIYGETEHMNAIFVDSLKRHKNVCNGCFKAIYTLSTHLALHHKIPFIVTGLSRGQFFETRLTEELFWADDLDVTKIDDTILEVRKLYHQEEDAIKELLDVSMFEDNAVFDKVQFIDFYRYTDVSLAEMLDFLNHKIGWVRPTDTGRSTNCLINQVGIYVHKKQKGYSNYAFPYSWDVRLGHKTRDESLEEINEYIHEAEVKRIMKEIGYEEPDLIESSDKLVAFYTGDSSKTSRELKSYLAKKVPSYMVPSVFKHIEEIPLTKNGKVDKKALMNYDVKVEASNNKYVAPRNEIEELLEGIWKEVLKLDKIGVYDNFITLGGHSLAAIRVTSRVNDELQMDIPLNKVFNLPTIETYAKYIEETITSLLEE